DAVRTGSRVYAEADLATPAGADGLAAADPAGEYHRPSDSRCAGENHRTGDDRRVSDDRRVDDHCENDRCENDHCEDGGCAGGPLPATRSVVAVVERACQMWERTAGSGSAGDAAAKSGADRTGAADGREPGEHGRAWGPSPIAVRPTRPGASARPTDPPVLITVSGRDGGE